MNTRILIILFVLFSSCVGVSKSELMRAKTIAISREQFAASPFGFEATPQNIGKHYDKILKRQRYFITSPVNAAQTDTIYRFYKGKTEIFFYKPMKLEPKLMGGNIYKPEIRLRNDICVGLSRKEFFWKFTDWTYDSADSLKIKSTDTDNTFVFVFSRDKLKSIRITK